MPSLNIAILCGHVTREIELKYLPNGTAVAQMGLAMNRKWRDSKTNEMKEEVTFVDIDLFGKTAELAAQYLKKGSAAMVEGRLKLDQWEDKQSGQKRSKLKVHGERVQFMDGKPKDGVQPAQRPTTSQRPQEDEGDEPPWA